MIKIIGTGLFIIAINAKKSLKPQTVISKENNAKDLKNEFTTKCYKYDVDSIASIKATPGLPEQQIKKDHPKSYKWECEKKDVIRLTGFKDDQCKDMDTNSIRKISKTEINDKLGEGSDFNCEGMEPWKIALIVISGVIALAVAGFIIYKYCCKKDKKNINKKSNISHAPTNVVTNVAQPQHIQPVMVPVQSQPVHHVMAPAAAQPVIVPVMQQPVHVQQVLVPVQQQPVQQQPLYMV